jgi:hypothetical protein
VPGKESKGVVFAQHTVARDIDKDGHTDLLASVQAMGGKDKETPAGLIALWGSSKGLSGGTYLKDVPEDYQSTGADDDPLVAGDFTADGHPDLVVRAGDEQGLVKGPFSRDGKPAGTGNVPNPFSGAAPGAAFVGAYAGDLDGDGTDDLIHSQTVEDDGAGGGEVQTSYVTGGPDGFGKPDTERLPGIETATTGDVDKDGYTDIVLRRFAKGSAPDTAVNGPSRSSTARQPDPTRNATPR